MAEVAGVNLGAIMFQDRLGYSQAYSNTTGGSGVTRVLRWDFTALTDGLIIVNTSINYALVAGSSNSLEVAFDDKIIGADTTCLTRAIPLTFFVSKGNHSIAVSGACTGSFSLYLSAVFIPNYLRA